MLYNHSNNYYDLWNSLIMKIFKICRCFTKTVDMLEQLIKPKDKLVEYCQVNFEMPILVDESINKIGKIASKEEKPVKSQTPTTKLKKEEDSDMVINISGHKPLTLSKQDLASLQQKLGNSKHIVCYCDGSGWSSASSRNASCAAVMYEKNRSELVKLGANLGMATNNVSEYFSVIIPLVILDILKKKNVDIYVDSLLICNQILGSYKVRNANLIELNSFV